MFAPHIVIINDGSDKIKTCIFESLKSMGCDVLIHTRNLGKGAAIKTGLEYVLIKYPDSCGIVTADADGQHSPQDIYCIAQCLEERKDGIVLGVRCLLDKQAPFKSKWGNKITSAVFWLKTGIRLRDTQTGLRAIQMRYVPDVSQVQGTRYEYETNVLLFASRMDIPLVMVPIDTIYIDNNNASHFRAVQDSARIYWGLLKFGGSSAVCAAVDFGLFFILTSLIFSSQTFGIAISTFLARIVSGACNFTINRFVVFKNKGKSAILKYLLLFLLQMFLSAQFTALLAQGLLNASVAKLIVDSTLFILSFTVQRKLVFQKEGGSHKKVAK